MSQHLPSFHDGYLTGVRRDDKRVVFALKRYDGERWEAPASGFEAKSRAVEAQDAALLMILPS